jgi:hypothetical protein
VPDVRVELLDHAVGQVSRFQDEPADPVRGDQPGPVEGRHQPPPDADPAAVELGARRAHLGHLENVHKPRLPDGLADPHPLPTHSASDTHRRDGGSPLEWCR